MLQLSDYEVYIFDCDGVILDSNQLKIDAMKNAVASYTSDVYLVEQCIKYFKNNFGKSRFHHVDIFVSDILKIDATLAEEAKVQLLALYSGQCKSLYMSAKISDGFIEFITALKGKKYVASGSEQSELREVFKERGLDQYFDEIYGSPEKKGNHIRAIIADADPSKAIMFGDAVSDLEAAKDNEVEFVFYSPLSNVKEKMLSLCQLDSYKVINSFRGVS